MIVDCHTHVWRSEHGPEELARESLRARARPATIDIKPESQWEAVRPVDGAVVFGLYARHAGLVVPNPNEANCLDELRRAVEGLKLRAETGTDLPEHSSHGSAYAADLRILPTS